MRNRRFVQVDVFSDDPTRGNGLAVVVDAQALSTEQMQNFAAWTNLAETTFLLPPSDARADYRVRIFTPGREMLFAGHPTLGSCAAWLHTGHHPQVPGTVVQECGIGLVDIDLSRDAPAFVAPPTEIAVLSDEAMDQYGKVLRLERSKILRGVRLKNGPVWNVLELASAQDVLGVDASLVSWPTYTGLSLLGAHPKGSECDYEVRNISPSSGMAEDPITGSLNSAIAKWMQSEGRLKAPLVIAQGTRIGRKGRVFVTPDSGASERVYIGGHSTIVIQGSVVI